MIEVHIAILFICVGCSLVLGLVAGTIVVTNTRQRLDSLQRAYDELNDAYHRLEAKRTSGEVAG